MVSSQSDVSLLGTVGSDQSVDVFNVDFVQFLNGLLDLVLVGLDVHLEDEDVTVFDLLHSGFRGNGGDDDLVVVHAVVVGDSLSGVLPVTSQLEGVGSVEGGQGSDLLHLVTVGTLQGSLLGSSSFSGYNVSIGFHTINSGNATGRKGIEQPSNDLTADIDDRSRSSVSDHFHDSKGCYIQGAIFACRK